MRKKTKKTVGATPTSIPESPQGNFLFMTGAICALAFLIRIVFVRIQADILNPDEIFQTVEQAHRMVFGYGFIPWEFQYGVRSPILPFFLSVVMRIGQYLLPAPGYIWATQVFLSLASIAVVFVACRWGVETGGLRGGTFAGLFTACSSDLIHMAGRALSEVFAANLLCVALLLVCTGKPRTFRRYFLVGILFGSCIVFRLQLAPAVGVVFLWTCRTQWHERWLPMTCGAAMAILLGSGAVDWFVYGSPFHSSYT